MIHTVIWHYSGSGHTSFAQSFFKTPAVLAVIMQPSSNHFCSACKSPMQCYTGDAHGFVQERAWLIHDSHSLLAWLQQCQHILCAVIFRNWWCLQCSYPAAICKVTIIANAALYEWLMFHTGYGVSFCMCFHPEVFDELWPFLHFKQEKQHALLFDNLPALLWDSTACTC